MHILTNDVGAEPAGSAHPRRRMAASARRAARTSRALESRPRPSLASASGPPSSAEERSAVACASIVLTGGREHAEIVAHDFVGRRFDPCREIRVSCAAPILPITRHRPPDASDRRSPAVVCKFTMASLRSLQTRSGSAGALRLSAKRTACKKMRAPTAADVLRDRTLEAKLGQMLDPCSLRTALAHDRAVGQDNSATADIGFRSDPMDDERGGQNPTNMSAAFDPTQKIPDAAHAKAILDGKDARRSATHLLDARHRFLPTQKITPHGARKTTSLAPAGRTQGAPQAAVRQGRSTPLRKKAAGREHRDIVTCSLEQLPSDRTRSFGSKLLVDLGPGPVSDLLTVYGHQGSGLGRKHRCPIATSVPARDHPDTDALQQPQATTHRQGKEAAQSTVDPLQRANEFPDDRAPAQRAGRSEPTRRRGNDAGRRGVYGPPVAVEPPEASRAGSGSKREVYEDRRTVRVLPDRADALDGSSDTGADTDAIASLRAALPTFAEDGPEPLGSRRYDGFQRSAVARPYRAPSSAPNVSGFIAPALRKGRRPSTPTPTPTPRGLTRRLTGIRQTNVSRRRPTLLPPDLLRTPSGASNAQAAGIEQKARRTLARPSRVRTESVIRTYPCRLSGRSTPAARQVENSGLPPCVDQS